MKLGISWNSYGGDLTRDEQITLMKKNGFEATFMGSKNNDPDENINALRQAGIDVETLHAPYDRINDIWYAGDAGDEMLNRLIGCAEAAKRNHVPVIIVHMSSGLKPPMISDIGNARFAKLVEKARALGVTLAFENQRMLANLSLMFDYYEDARFCWDVGHEACFTPGREYMPLFGGKLVALHIHDNTCEFCKDYHMLPYDGKIDFDHVAKQIAESGFEGTVMLEVGRWGSKFYDDMSAEDYFARAGEATRKLRDKIQSYR